MQVNARPYLLVLALAGLVLAASPASAGADRASVTPGIVAPEAPIHLTFRVSGGLVDVTLGERVSCTIAGQGLHMSPCSRTGSLLEVRVLGDIREFVFATTAPAKPGTYRVDFRAEGGLLSAGHSASTTFEVRAPVDPVLPAASPEPPSPTAPTTEATVARPLSKVLSDADRLLVASSTATVSLFALFAASRFPR